MDQYSRHICVNITQNTKFIISLNFPRGFKGSIDQHGFSGEACWPRKSCLRTLRKIKEVKKPAGDTRLPASKTKVFSSQWLINSVLLLVSFRQTEILLLLRSCNLLNLHTISQILSSSKDPTVWLWDHQISAAPTSSSLYLWSQTEGPHVGPKLYKLWWEWWSVQCCIDISIGIWVQLNTKDVNKVVNEWTCCLQKQWCAEVLLKFSNSKPKSVIVTLCCISP